MSFIEAILSAYDVNRERTLVTLDAVAALDDPQAALSWRPGSGRAHIGWQLMHIAVTEELFATERFLGKSPAFPELCEQFRGGSTPADDNVPKAEQLRVVLEQSRSHLEATLARFSDEELQNVPEGLSARGWTLQRALQIINWHEAHHQGQAHLTLNLFQNRNV